MTELTAEEYESRDITIGGFVVAMWDVFLMGLFITGGFYGLQISSSSDTVRNILFYLTVGLFFVFLGFGKFHALLQPRDNYECVVRKKMKQLHSMVGVD